MRLKDLFTVPAGQKVTEKGLHRVLVSSICSILLCMTCLVSTTWAWFAVSVENTGNSIEIAAPSVVVKTKDGDTVISPGNNDGSYSLSSGDYTIGIYPEDASAEAKLPNDQKCAVYVAMTIQYKKTTEENTTEGNTSKCYYFEFDNREKKQSFQITVGSGVDAVSFSVSWLKPPNATCIDDESLAIGDIPSEATSESATESTGASTPEETTSPVTETTAASEETSTHPTESIAWSDVGETTEPVHDPTETTEAPSES